jgi:HK97 family phage portal protein
VGLLDILRSANAAANNAALRAITPQDFGRGSDAADDWFDTRAGESVTLDSVLGIQHVWACVSLLVNDIRKLPIDTFRDMGGGRRVPIDKPRWMVRPDPQNQNMSFRDHIAQAVMSYLVDGNIFLYAWPSVFNVEILLVLDPHKVDIRKGRYVINVPGFPEPLTDLNVKHIRNLVKPGSSRGINPIQAAREGFGLTLAAEQFGQRFFTNGAVMSGVIETPQGATVDADKLASAFARRHDAKRKSHAVGVLTGGATFRSLSFSPEDTQFLELRRFQLEDTARLFHIPPFKIGSTDPGAVAYASTSNARLDYVQEAIEPIVVPLEDAYSDLIPGNDTYAKFNLNALMRSDPGARYAAYNTMLQAGVITKDEVRRWEDWGPADEAFGRDTEHGSFLITPNLPSPATAKVASLLEQLQAGLVTTDEARVEMGRSPMEWSTEISPEENTMILDRVKAGLLTEDEARELFGLPPMQWSSDLTPDEVTSLLEQLKAGVLTHDEFREMLGRPPVEWSDDLGPEDVDSLIRQVETGLLTIDEGREMLGRQPREWADDPSPEDIDVLATQVKEGLLTIDEARETLGRPPVVWPEDLGEKVEQAGSLIRAGFDPADVLQKLGLPPIKHLGLPPVTVQKALDADPEAEPQPDADPDAIPEEVTE